MRFINITSETTTLWFITIYATAIYEILATDIAKLTDLFTLMITLKFWNRQVNYVVVIFNETELLIIERAHCIRLCFIHILLRKIIIFNLFI